MYSFNGPIVETMWRLGEKDMILPQQLKIGDFVAGHWMISQKRSHSELALLRIGIVLQQNITTASAEFCKFKVKIYKFTLYSHTPEQSLTTFTWTARQDI